MASSDEQFPLNVQYFSVSRPLPYITHVEINRPSKLNAFIPPMWLELRQIFQHLSSSPEVRAILLSGAGDRAFTAGLDIQSAAVSGPLAPSASPSTSSTSPTPTESLDPARRAATIRRHIYEFQDCISAVERCEKRTFPPRFHPMQSHPIPSHPIHRISTPLDSSQAIC